MGLIALITIGRALSGTLNHKVERSSILYRMGIEFFIYLVASCILGILLKSAMRTNPYNWHVRTITQLRTASISMWSLSLTSFVLIPLFAYLIPAFTIKEKAYIITSWWTNFINHKARAQKAEIVD